ncbi:MAG: hypothetical protein ACLPWD_07750 [Methanobacterium sp.]
MKKTEFFGITTILMIILFLVIYNTSSNTTTSNNKVFENQFVKFNYPSNFNIVDKSNATYLMIVIYNGNTSNINNAIGIISVSETNKNMQMTPSNEKTTISGYAAQIEMNQEDSGAEIFLTDNLGLFILLNSTYDSDVNIIVNSFIIKNAPTQITPNTAFNNLTG